MRPMLRRRLRLSLAGALVATALGLGALLLTFSGSPLPAPAPFAGPLPAASPPAERSIAALLTGVTRRRAAFGHRGGSFFERREFSMAALLVRHPRGDLRRHRLRSRDRCALRPDAVAVPRRDPLRAVDLRPSSSTSSTATARSWSCRRRATRRAR